LALAEKGRSVGRARTVQALSLAGLGKWEPLAELVTASSNGGSPISSATILKVAERAEKANDWTNAEIYYAKLSDLPADVPEGVFGIRGLGWALFQQKKYPLAEERFAQLVQRFPEHLLAAEGRYYRAECRYQSGDIAGAAAGYQAAFQELRPTLPAKPGDEQSPPLVFAYRAGLQAARTLRQQAKVVEADAQYQAILQVFPQPRNGDRLLDEWALLNYEAERYEKADELFKRLVAEYPNSDLADNARLSLAESDLLSGNVAAAEGAFRDLEQSAASDAEVTERSLYQLLSIAFDQQRWLDVATLANRFIEKYPQSQSVPFAKLCKVEGALADPNLPATQLATARTELQTLRETLTVRAVSEEMWGARVWVLLAEASLRMKDYPAVVETVNELGQVSPAPDLAYQAFEVLGRAYKQQSQFAEARKAFDTVLAAPAAFRTETAAKSQFLIAETYLLQEDWPNAFLGYQKVYASYEFPKWQAAALLQSAKCDEQQGEWGQAVLTYERLLKEFPDSSFAAEATERLKFARQKPAKTP
jgi:cellulose synthase operon protein C